MYSQLLISCFLIHYTIAGDLNISKDDDEDSIPNAVGNHNNLKVPNWKQHFWKPPKRVPHKNSTYIDKAENMIRLPARSPADSKKESKKLWKKSPKRTIQKIIKKNRQKTKKIYVIKMTSPSTKSPEDLDVGQDESRGNEGSTTSPPNKKKYDRKHNAKIPRYPMPFKNLQRRNRKRDKRNVGDDYFILKDFNQLKFVGDPLDKNKDYIVAKTNFKNYW